MFVIKKIGLIFAFVLLVGLFAGCSDSAASGEGAGMSVMSVRHRETGEIVSLGFTSSQVTAITGTSERDPMEFQEDGVIRVGYWDKEGIYVDYLEDKVVAIRLTYTDDWELVTGVTPGMSKDEVEKLYQDYAQRESGLRGGLLLAFDEKLNVIEYREDAPYTLRVSYAEDLVDMIVLQDNLSY